MKLDPEDLQSPEAAAYWREILDLPSDTPIFDEQAIKAKFWPKPRIAPNLPYAGSDIRQCLCGTVVFIQLDGQRFDWEAPTEGHPHKCQPSPTLEVPRRIPDTPPIPKALDKPNSNSDKPDWGV